jgi:uncharacterized membrane protein YbhN (UPF0104 family)
MSVLGAIVTILLALSVGAIFHFVFKVTGPWGSLWTFLLVLILVGVAAAIWIPPIGPYYWDIAWIPIIFVIFLFAILLAAATPTKEDEHRYEKQRKVEEASPYPNKSGNGTEVATAAALGGFFWLLLILILIVILIGVFV